MPFEIIIVGNGIAGLGAAITLTDKGHNFTVVETIPKLQAIGGIIVIQPNANCVLDGLGIYEALLTLCSTSPFSLSARRHSDGEF